MKKVICILNENTDNFLFDIYLLKDRKGSKGYKNINPMNQIDYQLINKIPFSFKKESISNQKEIKKFILMFTKMLSKNRYLNCSLYISINIQSIIRDKFVFPKLSVNELRKTIDLELTKRYNNGYVKYYKKELEGNKLIVHSIIFDERIKNLIENIFTNIQMKVKRTSFLCENMNYLISKVIKDDSYVFLYQDSNYYEIIICNHKEPIYTYTAFNKIDKTNNDGKINSNILSRLVSLYGYYCNIITNKVYTLIFEGGNKIIEDITNLGLNVFPLDYQRRLDIDSVLIRNIKDDYEKLTS